MTVAVPIEHRFWNKAVLNKETGCLEWTACITPNGYPAVQLNGKKVGAHRVAYEMVKGAIPAGMQIDHLCRVPRCVNPDHLEAVTAQENINRRPNDYQGRNPWNRGKTHCKRGHAFTEENTYMNNKGRRVCRTCQRAHYKRYDAKRRAANG